MVQHRKMKWIAATCAVGVCSLAFADLADAQRRGGGGGGGARAGAARGGGGGAARANAGGGGGRQVRSNARPSVNQSAGRPGANGGGIRNNGGNNIHGGNGNNSGNTININNSHNYVDNGYHDNGWGHDYDWDDHWHPVATAAAVTATAIVIGSIVHSIPPSCVNVVMPTGTYYQCGSSWYQPQYVGTSVQYVVVAAPR